MHIISTILAVLFLSLTVLPCTDEAPVDCTSEVHFHARHGDAGEGHDHEQTSHTDDCSPFCTCHCCHVHFILKDFTYPNSKIEYIGTLVPYISHRYLQAAHAVWQPPRV